MRYTDYELSKVEMFPIFSEMKVLLFELTTNDEQRKKLESILNNGGYKDYSLTSNICSKNDSYLEMRRRLSMGYLLVRNEDTFDELVSNNINLFHGTNSNALDGILKNGLKSTELLEKEEVDIQTGESYTRTKYARDLDFVSFTDIIDIAYDYAEVKESEREKGVFNVIIGTSVDSIPSSKRLRVASDVSELGIKDGLDVDNIKMIGVPSDKVDYVKKLVDNGEINVVAVDGIDSRFYMLDNLEDIIYLHEYEKVRDEMFGNKELNTMLAELNQVKSNNQVAKK